MKPAAVIAALDRLGKSAESGGESPEWVAATVAALMRRALDPRTFKRLVRDRELVRAYEAKTASGYSYDHAVNALRNKFRLSRRSVLKALREDSNLCDQLSGLTPASKVTREIERS